MDKQKQQLIITIVLVVVLCVVLANNLKPKKKRGEPVILPQETAQPLPVAAVSRIINSAAVVASVQDLDEQKKRMKTEWGLDPFYHAVKKEIYQSSSFVLKGVSMGTQKNGYAFVNDQILTAGDTIAGYQVMEVQKNKVLLGKGNEKFYLVMPEQ